MLFYSGGSVLTSARVIDGVGKVWLDNVACNGSESDLSACSHAPYGLTDCQHSEDVGVSCGNYMQPIHFS
jgi:hypothetical protein